jgi:hypothetical protein
VVVTSAPKAVDSFTLPTLPHPLWANNGVELPRRQDSAFGWAARDLSEPMILLVRATVTSQRRDLDTSAAGSGDASTRSTGPALLTRSCAINDERFPQRPYRPASTSACRSASAMTVNIGLAIGLDGNKPVSHT